MMRLRIMAIGLCCLLLASCAAKRENAPPEQGGDGTTTADLVMGRYVEENWDLPGGISAQAMAIAPSGQIVALGEGECYIRSGDSWQEASPAWFTGLRDRGCTPAALAINAAGTIAVSYRDPDTGEVGIAAGTEEDGLQPVPLDTDTATAELGEPFSPFPETLLLGDDGCYYIRSWYVPVVFDSDGRYLRHYPELFGRPMAVGGEWCATLEDYDTIALYSAASGAEPEYIPTDSAYSVMESTALAIGENGSLFLAGKKGLFHRTPGGSVWEKVLEGAPTSLAVDTVNGLFPHGDKEFLLYLAGGGIRNLRYDPDIPMVPTTELTLYAMAMQNPTLDRAIYTFRQQRQDVSVRVVSLIEASAQGSTDDSIRLVNTELLAGAGPDLFELGYLPVEAYIRKGLLADLSEWVNPLIEADAILPGIARAYERDGGIYAIPARFSAPTVWGGKEAVAACTSLAGLADYAQVHPETQLLGYTDLQSAVMGDIFYTTCAPAWTADDGTLDEGAIAGFLTDMKRLVEASPSEEDRNLIKEIVSVANGKLGLYCTDLSSLGEVSWAAGAVSWLGGIRPDSHGERPVRADAAFIRDYFALAPGQVSGAYRPGYLMGVNAASPHAELAQEFLQCMFSEEVLAHDDFTSGLPIHRGALRAEEAAARMAAVHNIRLAEMQ